MSTIFSWTFCASLLFVGHAKLSNFAVVRPFATVDTAQISSSFDVWNHHPPCGTGTRVPVDLFLCFSQTLATNPDAFQATKKVIDEFTAKKKAGKKDTWHHCFRTVRAVSAKLSFHDDIYEPLQQETNISWARGPNMQFLQMAQAFQNGTWGKYSAWYLMEMDSVPRKENWLVSLLSEVDAKVPIGVLGSYYRGDAWDELHLSQEVRMHINGNAVYNMSSPLLRGFVQQLAADFAHPEKNVGNVAFDVLLTQYYLQQELTAAQFKWFDGESSVIGNYAHTAMLEKHFHGEAIVHGGTVYAAWDYRANPISLVVSDFGLLGDDGQPVLSTFRRKLLSGHHPFRKVVVMRPRQSAISNYSDIVEGDEGHETISFTEVQRPQGAWLDWCSAKVSTEWFAYTNTFFDFGRRIDLLRDLTSNAPVITWLDATSASCANHSSCTTSVRHASEYAGQFLRYHVDAHQIVFHTASRDAFCSDWQKWWQARPANSAQLDPIYGPSGDDYVAYVLTHNLESLYAWKDSNQQADRPCGVINGTECEVLPNQDICEHTNGCSWHPRFETCFTGKLTTNVKPPSIKFVAEYTESCMQDIIHPSIHIETDESSPVNCSVQFIGPFTSTTVQLVASVGAPGLIKIEGPPTTPLPPKNGVDTGALVLRTDTRPHLIQLIPFEVFDLRGWTLAVGYNGPLMVISTAAKDSILSADQPMSSAVSTNTRMVFDASSLVADGTKQIVVEQVAWRGISEKRHVKKCHTVRISPPKPSTSPKASRSPSHSAVRKIIKNPKAFSPSPKKPSASRSMSPKVKAPRSPLRSLSASPRPSQSPGASQSPVASRSPAASSSPSASRSPVVSPMSSQSPQYPSPSPSHSYVPKTKKTTKKDASEVADEEVASATPSVVPWIVIGVVIPAVLVLGVGGWMAVKRHRTAEVLQELEVSQQMPRLSPLSTPAHCFVGEEEEPAPSDEKAVVEKPVDRTFADEKLSSDMA